MQNAPPAQQEQQQQIGTLDANDNPDNAVDPVDSETEDGGEPEDENDNEGSVAPAPAADAPPPLAAGRIKSYGISEYSFAYSSLNPKPRSPSSPSLLPAPLKRKFDLLEPEGSEEDERGRFQDYKEGYV